jgi:hypothetical protein
MEHESIAASLSSIVLGGSAVIRGVRVRRRSLLGFQVGAREELLDPQQAARWIGALAKCRPIRISVCFRCGGDGLGRRDRGVCGLCRGSGIEVVAPPLGWGEASPEDARVALERSLAALAGARFPRAKASLSALIQEIAARVPEEARRGAEDAIARSGGLAEAG